MTKPQKIALGCIGTAILLFVLIGMLVWRHTDFGDAAANFNKAVADYKKAGLPWVAADLAQKPPVKDDENAAPLIYKAIETQRKIKSVHIKETRLNDALRSLDSKQLNQSLVELKPLLDEAYVVVTRSRCDFKHDLDLGCWGVNPELATLKDLAKLLRADAIIAAREHKAKRATMDIWAMHQLGVDAGTDQSIIGMLVKIAIQVIESRAIEDICEAFHGDATSLELIGNVFNKLDKNINFEKYMVAESYMALSTFRNLGNASKIQSFVESHKTSTKLPPSPQCLVRDGQPKKLIAKIMMCRMLQVWTRSIAIIRESKSTEDAAKLVDKYVKSPEVNHWSYILADTLMPAYSGAGLAVTKWQGTQAATEAMVKVMIYQAKTGRLPDSLEEAKIQTRDPYTNKPLIYRRTGNTFKVYSVGPDHKDNGGTRNEEVKSAGKKVKEFDLVASYPAFRRPSQKAQNEAVSTKPSRKN